ncbi:restriction endonuclease subunit S [Gemmiger formicilis]|uniref:restriction endonuclease subunit S n=1 Tax=Gemmiger formicilis TaxID=745368 RepID=UPI003995A5DF
MREIELSSVITDIAAGPFGSNLKVECFVPSGFPIVDGANLKSYKVTDNITKFVTEKKARSLGRSIAKRGDVIVTISGTLGQISYIPDDSKYTEYLCSQRQFRVSFDESKVYAPYLVFYFHTYEGQNKILSFANQTGVPALSQPLKNFKKIRLQLPPLEQQKKIASVIEAINRKIEYNQKINDNLYAQAKAIFDNHFINIDAIPARWRKGNLLDIANYLNGLAMQKFRPQGNEIGLPVLKIKELRQGSCDDSSELCSLSIKPEYIIHDGDVVFSWSGSLLVDIWCGGTCGLNQHLFKVTSDVYDKWFYYLWTAHHLARFIAIAADKATTMGHIKREELAKAEVLIPCEEDYTSFNSIMQPIFELIISNRIESRKLAALRDELLPKLMTGEIDVSDVQL